MLNHENHALKEKTFISYFHSFGVVVVMHFQMNDLEARDKITSCKLILITINFPGISEPCDYEITTNFKVCTVVYMEVKKTCDLSQKLH